MRSASVFWPGYEAEIQGKRPSYYLHYDDKFPDEQRVDQILAWLNLPGRERPRCITLYCANVAHAGNAFVPLDPETGEAVVLVNGRTAKLTDRTARLGQAM